jgi:hypothetical protein
VLYPTRTSAPFRGGTQKTGDHVSVYSIRTTRPPRGGRRKTGVGVVGVFPSSSSLWPLSGHVRMPIDKRVSGFSKLLHQLHKRLLLLVWFQAFVLLCLLGGIIMLIAHMTKQGRNGRGITFGEASDPETCRLGPDVCFCAEELAASSSAGCEVRRLDHPLIRAGTKPSTASP